MAVHCWTLVPAAVPAPDTSRALPVPANASSYRPVSASALATTRCAPVMFEAHRRTSAPSADDPPATSRQREAEQAGTTT